MDLRREEALQAILRRALHLGDREVARRPLRHVAAQLGLEFDETQPDWTALACEATKVFLDVSQERARRQQGLYEQPTIFFRRAVATAEPAAMLHSTVAAGMAVAPAAFAADGAFHGFVAPTPASCATDMCDMVSKALPEAAPKAESEQKESPASGNERSACASSSGHSTSTSMTNAIVPAGLDIPEGYDEQSWQKARIAARPLRILVNRKLLSEPSRAALAKPRGITLTKAIELYYELVSWGYRAPFSKHQKRAEIPEKLRNAPVEARLCEDHRSKRRLALDY